MLFRFIMMVHVCAAFPLKCPEPAQWSIRARGHCSVPSKYFCLKNDLIQGYSENCTVFDFQQPGRKGVLRGGLDADICSPERYQPWPIKFYTNVSTNCIFLKSACNEEGQLVFSHGNRNTDSACSCDYTKDYNFLVKPRNPCFCVPSEEDCSCHLDICQDSRYVLSPDYECINPLKNTTITRCKPINNERIKRKENESGIENTLQRQHISPPEDYRVAVALFVTSCLPVFIFLSFPLAVGLIIIKTAITHCYKEHIYLTNGLTIDPKEPMEGNDISLVCEINKKDIPAVWYKNGSRLENTNKTNIDVNERKHTLKIAMAELGDSGEYSIDVEGVNSNIIVKVEAYLSENLKTDMNSPTEEDDITIRCEVVQENCEQFVIQWSKDDHPVKITDRLYTKTIDRMNLLVLKNCTIYDSGVYSINVDGRKRSLNLDVKAKYNIPLTIENMNEADKRRNIKILKTGNGKRYNLKIVILGKEGVGKTSLMKRMIREQIEDVKPTDGIDIVKRCKIDIESGKWIFCEDDTTAERIGRVIRKAQETESDTQSKKQEEKTLAENSQSRTYSQPVEDAERLNGRYTTSLKDEHNKDDTKKADICVPYLYETRKDGNFEMSFIKDEDKTIKQKIIEPEETQINHLETVLRIGCNAKVSNREFADCIIMDFAGHKDYYSTHQTFITSNAIYLIVLSLNDENTFAERLDETEKISFWIDNIHCYASQNHRNSGYNPPIITVCTGDKSEEDEDHVNRKKEWKNKFKKILKTNQRSCHVRDDIFYISNTKPSENGFEELRSLIYTFGKRLPDWGKDYPVRWIILERALNKQRSNGKHVLKLKEIREMVKEVSVEIADIEMIEFLKCQHEIGNLIFYNEKRLFDFVIIKPAWLIDALKCIICEDKFRQFSERPSVRALQNLDETGVINFDLFKNMVVGKSPHYREHVQSVAHALEKFDIIVKDKLNQELFICPSVIKTRSCSIDEIYRKNDLSKGKSYRSPWLCLEFKFLPPAVYNHLLVFCLRNHHFEYPKLFHEIGIFCIKGSNGLDKIVLCKTKHTIAFQICSKQKIKNTTNGPNFLANIKNEIEAAVRKYSLAVDYKFKFGCGDVPFDALKETYDLDKNKSNTTGHCPCQYHPSGHILDIMSKFWVRQTKKKIEDEYKKKGWKKCQQCKKMSTFWCHDCKLFCCKDCYRRLHDKEKYAHHSCQAISDKYTLNLEFIPKGNLSVIWDIKCLPNGLLVLLNDDSQLIIFSDSCEQLQSIPMKKPATRISELDSDTIAVFGNQYHKLEVYIVDINGRNYPRCIQNRSISWNLFTQFIYIDNKLYIAVDSEIIVVEISGAIKEHIKLCFRPLDMCYDPRLERIYCIDTNRSELFCIAKDGYTLFTYTDLNMRNPVCLTLADEGNILVLCKDKNNCFNVIKVDSDGQSGEIVISDIKTNDYARLCFHGATKSVVLGSDESVYIYKEV